MTSLVIGANGYLGSHVTRQLVESGEDVRVMVRESAKTIGIDDLPVTRFVGDIGNSEVLRQAMTGCNVLDVAVEPAVAAGLTKFVFTSSYVTVGRRRGRVATESDVIGAGDLKRLTPYVRSRVQAENLVMEYARDRGLPAVAMCVSTTYGAGDWGRTPHGAIIAGAAFQKLPFVMGGIELEAVGVDDAARAMVLAAEKGRVGERYLISEKMISNTDVVRIAADAVGVPPPTKTIPLALSYAMAALGSAKARLKGTDERLSLDSLRLMRAEAPVDCSKAKRELSWEPRPVEEAIGEAAKFWVGLRNAKRASRSAG